MKGRTVVLAMIVAGSAWGATYEVGPGKVLQAIGEVPWETLAPGDLVLIHGRPQPYREKWVIGRQGMPNAPITVRGVQENGQWPVIAGDGATTRTALNYWNEDRGIIKIGGSNKPVDTEPQYIVIENLEIVGARPPYTFTGRAGMGSYSQNASTVYIEKGDHIVLRNLTVHDAGNGLFVAPATSDVVIEGCHIYDNGIANDIYEHNTYTEANGILYQFNWFGPLRASCDGNNLKDRSAGTVIRYNWIEGGNRQLDLVDSAVYQNDPKWGTTFVYGNVLVEPDGAGNSQIAHFGGDSGTTADYRGTLHFYNNTVVSTRSDHTTLLRLSTNTQKADVRNNIVFVGAAGSNLALLDSAGAIEIQSNWFKTGWVASHSNLTGTIKDDGGEGGLNPGFVDGANQDFHLAGGSPCIDRGATLHPAVLPANDVTEMYVQVQSGEPRPKVGTIDIGAFEFCVNCGMAGDGGMAMDLSMGNQDLAGADLAGMGVGDGGGMVPPNCGCRVGGRARGGWWMGLMLIGLLLMARAREG